MAEWKEYTAKTVNEALTNAVVQLETTSDKLEYEVIEKETAGLLGLFSKPAIIRARVKDSLPDVAANFLKNVFEAMDISAEVEIELDELENVMNIDMSGDEMGILIGKRGITLDSLQYLVSLVVNRNTENYVKIKLDTENYRERRRETLENLAHNLAHKVKRTHRPVSLEPMNPYERRVIHSALQKDKFVETHSEGDEPYRKVVITLKPGVDTGYERRDRYSYGNGRSYGRGNRGGYRRRNDYYKKNYNDNYSPSEETEDTAVENTASEEE
ncbi:MAG: protein jag [Ruminococcus flavefaciens]|nr:protein jag [Ruminococcus flavefaciens]